MQTQRDRWRPIWWPDEGMCLRRRDAWEGWDRGERERETNLGFPKIDPTTFYLYIFQNRKLTSSYDNFLIRHPIYMCRVSTNLYRQTLQLS